MNDEAIRECIHTGIRAAILRVVRTENTSATHAYLAALLRCVMTEAVARGGDAALERITFQVEKGTNLWTVNVRPCAVDAEARAAWSRLFPETPASLVHP